MVLGGKFPIKDKLYFLDRDKNYSSTINTDIICEQSYLTAYEMKH